MSYRCAIYNRKIPEFAENTARGRWESAIFHEYIHEEIVSSILNRQFFSFAPSDNIWCRKENTALTNIWFASPYMGRGFFCHKTISFPALPKILHSRSWCLATKHHLFCIFNCHGPRACLPVRADTICATCLNKRLYILVTTNLDFRPRWLRKLTFLFSPFFVETFLTFLLGIRF